MTSLLEDLQWRGLVQQCTHEDELRQRLNAGPLTLYCGFDPTAQSLHVGNLVPLIALARFQRAGHRALALVGGATGLIGDPSGKSTERVLQSEDQVQERANRIATQLAKFIDTRDMSCGAVVNNLEWTAGVSVLTFLRDVGKHFSVGAMLRRDSVQSRLEREGEGISFTEFTYMLLQAFDFHELARLHGCSLQIGGSDQWGNMISGTDLIRRRLGQDAFALTFPLLTTHDGAKFGKSEKGAVWLDPSMTSVWDFHQFWLNTADADVIRLLKMFTFVERADIEALELEVSSNPGARAAQRRLAAEMTTLVHGAEASTEVEAAAAVLFGRGSVETLSAGAVSRLAEALPCLELTASDLEHVTAAGLVHKTGLEASMTKANEVCRSGGVTVNGQRIADARQPVKDMPPMHGKWWLVKKGKKSFALARISET
jgi:tyrosyl-tRNA synthetase